MTFVFRGHRLQIETEYEKITRIGESRHLETKPQIISLDLYILNEETAIEAVKEYFAAIRLAGVT